MKTRRQSNESLDTRAEALEANDERVYASYWRTITAVVSSGTPIDLDAKDEDTHNAVTTGASWRFTCPPGKGGLYMVGGAMNFSTGGRISLYKNGTIYKTMGYDNASIDSSYFGLVSLVPGDYIDVRPETSPTVAGNASQGATSSNINIARVSK